jgi:Protein kinase domain
MGCVIGNDDPRQREALERLVIDGDNLLASAAGPDMRVRLRREYLNWRQYAENALERVGVTASKQSDRHRDIVRDVIPADRIYAEVEAEVRGVLQDLRAAAEPPPANGEQRSFTSDRGEVYLYDVSEMLGSRGRFGRVYAATDVAGTPLPVKAVDVLTDPGRAAGDWAMVDRELEVARRASERPGLLPIVDYAHLDDQLLIVMPRAEGNLAEAIRIGMTRDQATAAIRDVAEALQQLAVALIAHRDLKPANILWWRRK